MTFGAHRGQPVDSGGGGQGGIMKELQSLNMVGKGSMYTYIDMQFIMKM